MESRKNEPKETGDVESSKEGLDAIHHIAPNIKELTEESLKKGSDTWARAVTTHLGRIMSEAQFLNDELVTSGYKERVEREGHEILGELRQQQLRDTEYVQRELQLLPEENKGDKIIPPLPSDDFQNHIYTAIFSLAPSQDELK